MHRLAPLLATLLLASCGSPAATPSVAPPAGAATARPVVRHVLANGVRLEVLDWGGRGDGLVFLHGLGDSPHAWDDIAPAFRDRFHVVAYAARGHGGSESRGPWDVPTLGEDLRQLLDGLGIRRAALVGWSMGGLEATELAVRHPERVAAVAFVDSYDLGGEQYAALMRSYPVPLDPAPADLAGRAAFRAWWKRVSAPDVAWTPAMRAEVEDLVAERPDGSLRLRPSDSASTALLAGLMQYHPHYDSIRAPLLTLWARPYAATAVPANAPDTMRAQAERWFRERLLPWQASVEAEVHRLVPAARVVVLDSSRHSALPFQRGDTIAAVLRRFLDDVAPR